MFSAAAIRRSAGLAKAARSITPIAHGHSLVVPYAHTAITDYKNGVPEQQVRDLAPHEKKWDFWTTSDAFLEIKPKFGGISWVPNGDIWVIQRAGKLHKVCQAGTHFLIPGLDKIKAVKTSYPVAMGVVSPGAVSKDGQRVDAYAVVYVKVTDPATSAFFVDAETNHVDSERAAAKVVRKIMNREIANIKVDASGQLSAADKSAIADKINAALKAKSDEFGLEAVSVEIRGVFPTDSNVPDKLRALDPPLRGEDAAGHGLSADYWSEVLSPPYFEKRTFGSTKEIRTPATVSLEWAIPSPPDYHHFNEVPRMTVPPSDHSAKGH
ncbi:band 7 family-domain-containing protein [Powellomyces hirtus]|nr:band 7 family-domain-containing protein [Powellomyces hirtus]